MRRGSNQPPQQAEGTASRWLRAFGLRRATDEDVVFPWGYGEEEKATYREAAPFTLTDRRRMLSLMCAVRYVVHHKIEGAVVECGVWKGGSMMIVARTLLNLGVTDRHLHLFDTFAGMTAPGEDDDCYDESVDARREFDESRVRGRDASAWNRGPLGEVKANVGSIGYAPDHVHYIEGRVEDTLPAGAPDAIALLRLDTDWYESTRHEMNHLYPRLATGGVLLVDDYLYWRGAGKAVDEYVAAQGIRLFLNPIDGGAAIGVKQD